MSAVPAIAGASGRMRQWLDASSGYVLPLAVCIGTPLLAWEIAARVYAVPEYLLPLPSAVFARLFTDYPLLLRQSLKTTSLVIEGFLAGVLPAIVLGYAMARFRMIERALYPFLVLTQTTPQIAIAPLLIVWFGYGDLPKIILAGLLTFFPVLVDSTTGFRSIDPRLYFVTRSMRASAWQTFWRVELPEALPSIFSGMKISLLTSATVIIVVEFISSSEGLGFVAVRALANQDLSLMFAAVLAGIIVGLLLNYLIEAIEYLAMPWMRWRSDIN